MGCCSSVPVKHVPLVEHEYTMATQKNCTKEELVFLFSDNFPPLPPTHPISGFPQPQIKDTLTRSDLTSTTEVSKMPAKEDEKAITKSKIGNLQMAIMIVNEAVKADNERNYKVAVKLYEESRKYFENAIKYEAATENGKDAIRKKLDIYVERMEKMKLFLKEVKEDRNSQDMDTKTLINQIESAILKERPNVRWSNVAGLEKAKEILKEALILPIKFPHLLSGDRKPWKAVLLFGPRGTGKTLLAKAAAAEAYMSHIIFSVKTVHLVNKWVGESEKSAKYLFDMARKQKPSLIFMDEIDSFCMVNSAKDSNEVRRMTKELLLQMQGMTSDNDGIVVLGATSNPWDLDDTILSWFEKKIYIPLPDEEARQAIFKFSIGNVRNMLLDEDFRTLASKTEGYSGEDIAVLVKNAMMQPFRKVQAATHFAKVIGLSPTDPSINVDDLLTPCSADHVGAIKMFWTDVPKDKLLEPAVTMDDMLNCLENSKPSVRQENLLKFQKFKESFSHESA